MSSHPAHSLSDRCSSLGRTEFVDVLLPRSIAQSANCFISWPAADGAPPAASGRYLICAIAVAAFFAATDLGFAQDTSFGQRLFQDKADCQFCHGPDGDGRGDPRSPGRAANLHETRLNRDQLIEVIACGRPGTEMPHFDKYAYEDTDCYGLKGKDLGSDAARDLHSTSLTRREIEAVADYVLAKFAGK